MSVIKKSFLFENATADSTCEYDVALNSSSARIEIYGDATAFELKAAGIFDKGEGSYQKVPFIFLSDYTIKDVAKANGIYMIDTMGLDFIKYTLSGVAGGSVTVKLKEFNGG